MVGEWIMDATAELPPRAARPGPPAEGLPERPADPAMRIRALVSFATMQADHGQFAAASSLIAQAEAEAARLQSPGLRCLVLAARAHLHIAQEDLTAALNVTERAAAHAPADDDSRATLLLTHARVLTLLGHWPDLAAALSELRNVPLGRWQWLQAEVLQARHDAASGRGHLAVQRLQAALDLIDGTGPGDAALVVGIADAAAAADWPDLAALIKRLRPHLPPEHISDHANLDWLTARDAFYRGLPFAAALASFVGTCERARLTALLGRAAHALPQLFLAGLADGIVSPLYPAVMPLLSADELEQLARLATDASQSAPVRVSAWQLLARQPDSPVTRQAARALSRGTAANTASPIDTQLAAAAGRLLQAPASNRPGRSAGALEFRTLGTVRLTYRGRESQVPWRRKAQALFALLIASHPRPLTRLHAQELLWPELCQQAAANNLRVVVHNLRRTLASLCADPAGAAESEPPIALVCEGDTLWLDGAEAVQWDARSLSAAAATARHCIAAGDLTGAMAAYSHAVTLYRGPFMPDPAFDTPFAPEREHYQHLAHEALVELAALHLDYGEPEQALPLAERAVDLDSLDGIGYQLIMRAYTALGYPHRAAAVYRRYTAALAATGSEPDATTERLLRQLLERRDAAPAALD